jgi:ribonuclease-3 family protein
VVIEPTLDDAERAVVRRARNASLRPSGRSHRNIRAYRAATALEALVAYWLLDGERGRARFLAVLAPPLERAIDTALRGRS